MISLGRKSQYYTDNANHKSRRPMSGTGSTIATPNGKRKVPTVPTVQNVDVNFFDAPKNKKKGPSEISPIWEDDVTKPVVKSNKKNKAPMTQRTGGQVPKVDFNREGFEQDFTKNYMDPLEERPGYFQNFNEELDQKQSEFLKKGKKGEKCVHLECTNATYDVCTFGKL